MGIQYRGYNGACTRMYGIQYSLVSTVWDTASTGSYGGTVFPGGIHHLLVNNVEYDIQWDTEFTLTPKQFHTEKFKFTVLAGFIVVCSYRSPWGTRRMV